MPALSASPSPTTAPTSSAGSGRRPASRFRDCSKTRCASSTGARWRSPARAAPMPASMPSGQVAAFTLERAIAGGRGRSRAQRAAARGVRVTSADEVAGLVSPAVRRAVEDLSLPDLEQRHRAARSNAATRGTCRARWTLRRWARRRGCSKGGTISPRFRPPASDVDHDRARRIIASRSDREVRFGSTKLGTHPELRSSVPQSAIRNPITLRGQRRAVFSGTWSARLSARWWRSAADAGRRSGWRDVLAARDRAHAGPTAPASGLFLVSVDYGPVCS